MSTDLVTVKVQIETDPAMIEVWMTTDLATIEVWMTRDLATMEVFNSEEDCSCSCSRFTDKKWESLKWLREANAA